MPVPPDLADPAATRIAEVAGALAVPVAAGEPGRSVQRSGVIAPSGEVVPESLTWRGRSLVSLPPAPPDPAKVADLPGTWMWGGIMFGHFGHFLVESTARLWAWPEVADRAQGILFVPKAPRNLEGVLKHQTPFLRLCGIGGEIRLADRPLRVERLFVPPMGFGLFEMIAGTPAYRAFMRENFARDIAPEGPERLYISRSRLPAERGGILGEARIEALLAAEGYEIFHPQLHPFAVQIARYKAARLLISPDGSPLHLVALCGNPALRVAIQPRRPDEIAKMLARQLDAFAGIGAVLLDSPARNWIPVRDSRPSRTSFGEIDLPAFAAALAGAGFIAGTGDWRNHDAEERAAILASLATRQKTEFRLHEEGAA